jgi:mannose-6-phosphate isomerase-like protein (cupin superfamily)
VVGVQRKFGYDPLDEYSKPVDVRVTNLAKVFMLNERANPEKPGRSISVVWDERLPLIDGFKNRYSYVVRFTQQHGKAGNHYHKLKQEIYYALHGQFTIVLEDIATKKREELHLSAGDGQFIYIPAMVAHVVISQTEDDALLVIASHPELSTDEFPHQVV